MIKGLSPFLPRSTGRRPIFIGLIGTFIITMIAHFGIGVRTQLHDLATANSDSIQWNMSQAEVEHLAFLLATKSALGPAEGPLDDVRRRFNVLYSRISALEVGEQYSSLRQLSAPAASLDKMRRFLDRNAPLIDSDDATLRANLTAIVDDALQAHAAVRDFSLQGISHFSDLKDKSRREISRTLLSIALLSALLFLLLCLMVVILSRLNTTNQRRARQMELDGSRLSAIVSTSLDAIMVVSSDGRVIEFNGAAEEIFGYSQADVIGQNMADVIVPDHLRDAHLAGMKRYHTDGSTNVIGKGRFRIDAKRKSGDVFPAELSIQTARGEDGEIFVSYIRDISKEVAAENELREARDRALAGEKSKARLLAVMSHEIRTPLNGLLGTMELLSQTDLTEQQTKYLGIMGKSGKLLLSHVNDVLDVSLLEAGHMEIKSSVFDLNKLIRDVVDSQSANAKSNANDLVFEGHAPEFLVNCDPVRVRQILLNLVGNAIKFTRNGRVTIETEPLEHSAYYEIRVIDDGVGIPEENIEKIFEDFITLDSTFGRKSEGTGLGLGIVRRIVDALDGSMGVASEVGQGSLFWVRLPIGLTQEVSSQTVEATESHAQSSEQVACPEVKPLDILMVEDNEINRVIASEFMALDGHNIVLAHDGREGVAFADQQHFDLILMDISMPDIDGIEATKRIRAGNGLSRDTPIAALTAHALEDDIRQFKAAGMCDVISKPVSGENLRSAVIRLSTGGQAEAVDTDASDVIDAVVVQEFKEQLGEDKFREIVQKLCQEMDEEIPAIARSHAPSCDHKALAQKAHKLRGSASVLGAAKLTKHLQKIENSAEMNDSDAQTEHLRNVEILWETTRCALLKQVSP